MKPPFEKMTAFYFFTHYVNIPNWRKKLSGKNSNGNPILFSDEEIKQIKSVWERYLSDLKDW